MSSSTSTLHVSKDQPPSTMALEFGALLKFWRSTRRYSQLELAIETNVSQRHLSFLESGRSRPSRDMVMHLAQRLCIPLRERNELLLAAGFAPVYLERSLHDEHMAEVRAALETTLRHHEPFPAFVVDRQWNIVLHNAGVDRLMSWVGNPEHVWKKVDASGQHNLIRFTFHPHGLQPLVVDWPQTAAALLARLQSEVQGNPANAGLKALLDELRTFPSVAGLPEAASIAPPFHPPALTLKLRKSRSTLQFFSMLCNFSSATDLTVDELRLELMFPSDEGTAQFLRQDATVQARKGQILTG